MSDDIKFDHNTLRVGEIQLDVCYPTELTEHERRFLRASGGVLPIHGGKQVRHVLINGEPLLPTGRFWSSLYSRFGLNSAFFKFLNI